MNISKEDQDLLKAFIASTNELRKSYYHKGFNESLMIRNGELAMKVYKAYFLPKEGRGSKYRQIRLEEAIANEKQSKS